MNILVFSHYFWPENFLINDLAEELSKKNNVTVITGYPNYPDGKLFKGYRFFLKKIDWFQNIKIIRSLILTRKNGSKLNLVLNYISFAFFSFFEILFLRNKKKFNLCFVYAPSPLISLISIFLLKRLFNFKIYLWLQDLWPLVVNNKTNNNLVKNIIFIICKYIYNNSDIILLQSKDYEYYLINKMKIINKDFIFFPNWSPNHQRIDYNSIIDDKLKIVYTGNIGYSQNFSNLIKLCNKDKLCNFEFHIYGEGRYKTRFQKDILKNKINNIFLHDNLPMKLLLKELTKYNCLYLSLSNEYSHTIPAKFQFYLSLGMPIIASIDGFVYELINSKNIGLASTSDDIYGLEKNLNIFSKFTQNEKKVIANNAYELYLEFFSKELAFKNFNNLIYEKKHY